MRVQVIYKLAALVTHNAASALLQAAKCGGVWGGTGTYSACLFQALL